MNSTNLNESLDCILCYLTQWEMPVAKILNPGLDSKYIVQCFERIGLNPTDELVELYSWRNRVSTNEEVLLDNIKFIPGFYIINLNDAITQYNALKIDTRWSPSWFPFMANGGGDFYAVELSNIYDNLSPVIGFLLSEIDQEIEYKNITGMMQTFCECLKRGVAYRSNEGFLELDDEKFSQIATKNNPNIEFWRS